MDPKYIVKATNAGEPIDTEALFRRWVHCPKWEPCPNCDVCIHVDCMPCCDCGAVYFVCNPIKGSQCDGSHCGEEWKFPFVEGDTCCNPNDPIELGECSTRYPPQERIDRITKSYQREITIVVFLQQIVKEIMIRAPALGFRHACNNGDAESILWEVDHNIFRFDSPANPRLPDDEEHRELIKVWKQTWEELVAKEDQIECAYYKQQEASRKAQNAV
jgi:hypothetical protein